MSEEPLQAVSKNMLRLKNHLSHAPLCVLTLLLFVSASAHAASVYSFGPSTLNIRKFDVSTEQLVDSFGTAAGDLTYGEGTVYSFAPSDGRIQTYDATSGAFTGAFGSGLGALDYGGGNIYTFY